ncbi:MAG: flagellar FliJ family protein [Myxococcales bacterium]|nr:flagellar FliJ family protein [Myxococcales bacterium]
MKRRSDRMAALLQVFEHRLAVAGAAFAEAQREVQSADAHADAVGRQAASGRTMLARGARQGMAAAEFRAVAAGVQVLGGEAHAARLAADEALDTSTKAREALLAQRVRVRALEALRERDDRREQHARLRDEQRQLDEVGLRVAGRGELR